MTELIEKAFAEISKLSSDEQDEVAAWILTELASERRWQEALADSADVLVELANEARAEYRAGKAKALDPDTL